MKYKNWNDLEFVYSPLQIKLLQLLEKNGPMDRDDLIKYTESPRTTIYDNLNKLRNKEIVIKVPKQTGKQGRPRIYFLLKEDKDRYITKRGKKVLY